MWAGESRTVAPIKLRWTIGKYQTAFSSFQQQDSQELLAFLLDGLHEDLNRVTDKPYVELKDSDGRPDVQVIRYLLTFCPPTSQMLTLRYRWRRRRGRIIVYGTSRS